MKVSANRDAGAYSLARVGTFRVGSTACQIPFKVRSLTTSPQCDAIFLQDDNEVHVNELFEMLSRKRFVALATPTERKEEEASLIARLKPVRRISNQNLIHLPTPKGVKYTKPLADAIVEILQCKNNNLILATLNEGRSTLNSRSVLLNSLRDAVSNEFLRQLVGYIPATCPKSTVDDLLKSYHKLGINAFAIDACNRDIPAGILGKVNAYLDKEMNGDFLVLALRTPEVGDGGGQTLMASDLSNLPRGYDGFAPPNLRFGRKKKDETRGMSEEEIKRYKAERTKDKKGKKRLFVPHFWGRTEISAVIDEEPELVSTDPNSPYRMKTLARHDISGLFQDEACSDIEFGRVLKCHDTELMETELRLLGEAARNGVIERTMRERDYAKSNMKIVVAERKAYEAALRDRSTQSEIG